MSTKRKKSGDSRNLIIGVLSVVVLIETFLLFNPQEKEILPQKSVATQNKIKKPVLAEKTAKAVPPSAVSAVVSPKVSSSQPVKKTLPAGRIAIVLDDWGYHLESCRAIEGISQPIAIAILPGLAHTKDIAQCAHDHRKVVMLHLPLEPHQYLEKYPANYIITTSMRQARVERLLKKSLDEVPFITGINNHMGSKATENRRLMSIVFSKLRERKLFFLDSMVTSKSICRDLAQEMHIEFAQRDVFLDNTNERTYIENQFAQLAKLARRKGSAVAIGHDRPLTLKIVKEQLDKLEKEGFEIVSIEEFLR